ncbi:MAG: DUF342 domain-containing protein [Thermoanaerobacteraceae bacterium]|nr:DUF342 domain-containing protein [Thermoanaerobacteraceae bacterium]
MSETSKSEEQKDVSSNESDLIEDAKLEIEISKNEMIATIWLTPPKGGKMITFETVMEEFAAKGIEYGINENKIKEILNNGIFNTPVDVAFGLPPTDGKDGKIQFYFDTNRDLKPKLLEDGTVDYHNLGLVINVKKGELLAEIIPPTKGIPGMTVTGKPVKAKDGKEPRIHAGKNVVISEDGYKAFADIDGQPILYNNKLSVLPVLEIKGDVGPATGNIDFLGSVIVLGNVKSGFAIKASQDLEVYGIVEAAQIEVEGNIIIKRGIQGQGKGILKAGRDFTARYIENATVKAGNNIIISEASMHSQLFAGKDIRLEGKKGLIVGGNAKAGEKLIAKTIGSPMSTYTEIEVGINPTLKMDYQNICNKLAELETDLHKIHQALGVLQRLKEKKLLTHEKQILLDKLMLTKDSLNSQQLELKSEKQRLDLVMSHSGRAKISASNICYSGVNIIIGNASLKVRDKISHVTFYNYEGQIKFGPYEG